MEFLSRNTLYFISPSLWPPNSPDLNPVDYEVWGVLQQRVYRCRIRDVDHLKQRTSWMSGVASTRTPSTEQFDSGVFDYARVSVQTEATLSTNWNWCFCVRTAKATFPYGNFCFWVPCLKQLLLRNCAVDFVEICNVYVGKMIIEAAKRIFNSNKICRSYSDLNFGVTFLGTQQADVTRADMSNNDGRCRSSLHYFVVL